MNDKRFYKILLWPYWKASSEIQMQTATFSAGTFSSWVEKRGLLQNVICRNHSAMITCRFDQTGELIAHFDSNMVKTKLMQDRTIGQFVLFIASSRVNQDALNSSSMDRFAHMTSCRSSRRSRFFPPFEKCIIAQMLKWKDVNFQKHVREWSPHGH